ncbi:MAG: hypothetical protein ACHQ3O_12620, partial [Candidatus Limnocylindria bacterium]
MIRLLVLLLTVLTGFSGLVYEVTWQRYLATLLGSHSEATAAVLGLFLGGLAAGYLVFGGVTRRLVARADAQGRSAPLLVVYGVVERTSQRLGQDRDGAAHENCRRQDQQRGEEHVEGEAQARAAMR